MLCLPSYLPTWKLSTGWMLSSLYSTAPYPLLHPIEKLCAYLDPILHQQHRRKGLTPYPHPLEGRVSRSFWLEKWFSWSILLDRRVGWFFVEAPYGVIDFPLCVFVLGKLRSIDIAIPFLFNNNVCSKLDSNDCDVILLWSALWMIDWGSP